MSKKNKLDLGSTLKKSKKSKDIQQIEKVVQTIHSERKKRLIIEMPESMHNQIKAKAATMGLTMKELVTNMINDSLNL